DFTRAEPPLVEDIEHYARRGLTTYNLISFVEPRGERPAVIVSRDGAQLPPRALALQHHPADLHTRGQRLPARDLQLGGVRAQPRRAAA
ncbi:MAG: hypothetical protein AB7Y46_21350, partial [Armatimonadota bacterium]